MIPSSFIGTVKSEKAREHTIRLMRKYGLLDWTFCFNDAKRRFGCCYYRKKRIELSYVLCEINTEEEILDTILHEIAHALVGPGHGHDEVWKKKCVEIGAKPERCYKDNVVSPKGKYLAKCPVCGAEISRYRKPSKHRIYFHKNCGRNSALTWRALSR